MTTLKSLAIAARSFIDMFKRNYVAEGAEYEDLDRQLREYEGIREHQHTEALATAQCGNCIHLRKLSLDMQACTHPKVTTQGEKNPIHLEADISYRNHCKGQWKVEPKPSA